MTMMKAMNQEERDRLCDVAVQMAEGFFYRQGQPIPPSSYETQTMSHALILLWKRRPIGSDDAIDGGWHEQNSESLKPQDQDRPKANMRQVGGEHYGLSSFQHWDMVNLFKLDYFQGQITKYVMRWRLKNGLPDLQKAQHFLEKYIELESKSKPEPVKIVPTKEWRGPLGAPVVGSKEHMDSIRKPAVDPASYCVICGGLGGHNPGCSQVQGGTDA